jgi:hypothetical protein
MRVREQREPEPRVQERPRREAAVAPYSAAHIAQLQRSVGNHAVARLLRAQRTLARDITPEEYERIKTIAEQVLQRFPPTQYRYVGLGKSPTPVLAFLQSYGERVNTDVQAMNMPLSKFGHRTEDMSSGERMFVDGAPLTDEQRGRLWQHFDRFIGNFDRLEDPKGIVLIDHVESGKSLFASARHLEQYLSERYYGTTSPLFWNLMSMTCCGPPRAPTVEMLPLAIAEQQGTKGNKKAMQALGLTEKALMLPGTLADKSSLAARMGGEHYKKTAEYPEDFKISAPEQPKTEDIQHDPKELYAQLRQELNTFINRDGDLVKAFRGEETIVHLEEQTSEAEGLLLMERVK